MNPSKNPKQPIAIQVRNEANSMTYIEVCGYKHVIRPYTREGIEPNYRNTGMAFCGIVPKGQTFNQFKKKWIARRIQFRNQ